MKRGGRYDKLLVGLLAGLLIPVIAFLVSWKITFDGSLREYFYQFQTINRLSSLISLSAIPNLLLFFVFIWLDMYRGARGVIFATLILALLMVIIKFL
jgi:hypothetical protein